MHSVTFLAFGHKNIIANHETTLELTSEDFLTKRGTCIIGVRSDLTLDKLDNDIKELAKLPDTKIQLSITVDNISTTITGHGSSGLTYADTASMVARTSYFECPRTIMVGADKSASDIDREIIRHLCVPQKEIECELLFINQ